VVLLLSNLDGLSCSPATNGASAQGNIAHTTPQNYKGMAEDTETFEESEKLCCETKAFLVVGEAERVAWLMEDRDEQILLVAAPGDGAFMQRNHMVICLCYV